MLCDEEGADLPLALLLAGHIYMILLVLVVQSLVYREITQLFQGTRDPWSKTLNWYFFAIANYYFYGETIIYYFKVSFIQLLYHSTDTRRSTSCSPRPSSILLQLITDSSALCYTSLVLLSLYLADIS